MKRFETNKNSFKLPDNYFNTLEDNILTESKKFTEEEGFSVPKNYFSTLENEIVSANLKPKKQAKVLKLWFTISSVAACLLIAAIFILPFNQSEKNTEVVNSSVKVDQKTENDVYESLYDSYFETEENKKSSNDITLDDLDEFYSKQQLSSNK